MDILRNLFGNVTSGIVRLAVTAGVLLLCYLLIVKPALKRGPDPKRLVHCVEHAKQDLKKIERCTRRF